ncbi:hypothetical protein [Paraburkholderia sp. J94]|uniref:hypothetical protein n=1 Tax=Paraburkholderia sp. J94 TaxID=2805441 RepID=UPI002AB144D6|nr:hypothetical protein [Paraburkholderia sp. J94]
MELDVIAATIIGCASLIGGKGRIGGTFVDVLFPGVIGNARSAIGYRHMRCDTSRQRKPWRSRQIVLIYSQEPGI